MSVVPINRGGKGDFEGGMTGRRSLLPLKAARPRPNLPGRDSLYLDLTGESY
jgi:hypothetical protein